MARKNLRSNFAMDTDELSMETTVPTDFSMSPDEVSDVAADYDKRRKISKQLLERKQLLHDMQVLKIELSQKGLMLDNVKADALQRIEELEEKLSDAVHQKQLLQARLESELTIQKADSRKRQEKIEKELETILRRQQQLEATNERLQEKAVDIRNSLRDLDMTENRYLDLKSQPEDNISLKDIVGIKLFETVRPWRIENTELKSRCRGLGDELHKYKSSSERLKDELQEERRKLTDLENKHQRLNMAYADVRSQVQQGDYKIENYDRVKLERDGFESELTDLKKNHAYLEASQSAVTRERDDYVTQLSSLKQSSALVQQDKDFFSRQLSETQNKLLYSEERIVQLNDQLDRAKMSREELYDKYVASRDQYKTEYEAKLRDELEQIRTRTNTEIDRLKTNTREMFERENRTLREARDLALNERDRAAAAEKDATAKYDQLVQDFRRTQMTGDSKISEMHNEVKLKSFEAERTQLVYEETVKNLRNCQTDNEKLAKKLEVLTKEYFTLQTSMEKRVSELESSLADRNTRLETYEKLEAELDDVVMQAAEIEQEEEAERVLFSYGYGANVPTTTKRRLQQSVNLARRVLQLERTNTSLRKEVEKQTERNKNLADKVKEANAILDQSQQPHHYLVESIRQRDAMVKKQKTHIEALEKDVGHLQKERSELIKTKNQMGLDLERLLQHKEEMSVMKQVMLSLSDRGKSAKMKSDPTLFQASKPSKAPSKQGPGSKKRTPTKTAVHQPQLEFEPAEKDDNVHNPAPTQFTVHSTTDWYSKLKEKHRAGESTYDVLTKPRS